jgi:hypothetical protein
VSTRSGWTDFESVAELIQRYANKYRWDPKKLRDVFNAIGPLPEEDQKKLTERLAKAFGAFQSLRKNVRRVPPTDTAKRIEAVKSNSRKLLAALDIGVKRVDWSLFDNPLFASGSASQRLDRVYECQHSREASGLGQSRGERRRRGDGRAALLALTVVRAELADLDDQVSLEAIKSKAQRDSEKVAEAALGLIWLFRQAGDAQVWVEVCRKRGRGGVDNPLTAEGLLIAGAFDIWAAFHRKTTIGYGGPLVGFVSSVANLFGAEIANNQIKNAWRTGRRRQRRQKENPLP